MKGKRLNTEEFIRRAREVHGDKYNYDKSDYIGYDQPIIITCKRHGDFLQRPNDHFHGAGCGKCALEARSKLQIGVSLTKNKKVFGVGINDYTGVVRTLGKTSDSYRHWKSMLERCCNTKHTWYQDCCVCDEWIYFSNFKEWFDDTQNGYVDGCCLDKDILFKGNKTYSPSTCCFVPPEINTLIVKRKALRGECPIGVTKRRNGKYVAQMRKYGKLQNLGTYLTKDDAFYAYKKAKEEYIKEVAQKYFDDGKITKRVYDALMNYEVETTD